MKIDNFRLLPKEQYPLILGESKYSPEKLYVAGTLPSPTTSSGDRSEQLTGIAMVGTRRPSNSARDLCKRLVHSLAGTRAVIVSGLAQGIDSLCHEAALDESLPTVAVLAQGLASRIEGSRRRLAERILEAGGAIVSQFEPDEPAYRGNFPTRNKLISGMSCATVIVQSKPSGGAMLTGDFCIKEGKPLFAVPGDFDNEVASGPNMLLDQGRARPVFRPESLRELLAYIICECIQVFIY